MIKDVHINSPKCRSRRDRIPGRDAGFAHIPREHGDFGFAVVPGRSPSPVPDDSVLYHAQIRTEGKGILREFGEWSLHCRRPKPRAIGFPSQSPRTTATRTLPLLQASRLMPFQTPAIRRRTQSWHGQFRAVKYPRSPAMTEAVFEE